MATKPGKNAQAAFEIANLLDDAADAIRKRSKAAYAAGRMSLEEYIEARAQELELRSELSVIVASELGEAQEATVALEANIERAILDAKEQIEKVSSVKSGLKIVAALVSLAGALASGDAKLILRTGKAVADVS